MFSPLTRTAWFIALAHLILEVCNNFLPVVYPILINTMGLTYTQVGLVVLVAGICGTVTQPFFGYLSDRWGSRRLTVLSIAWIGLVMGLVGFAWNYLSLVVLVGLGALGSAAFHPAGASVALRGSQSNRRGSSVAVFSVGGNLGTALSPLWMTVGMSWLGLPGTSLLIPLALLFSLILYQQLYHGEQWEPSPSTPSPGQNQSSRSKKIQNGVLVGLMLVVMATMARTWFQVTLMTYLPEWIQSQGYSLAFGGQMLSVMLVFIGVGSLTGGTLSDYIGRWQVLALSLVLLAPAYWLFLIAGGVVQVVLAAVMGVLIGASFPVGLVMAQDAWPNRVGVATALMMGLGWATGGLGASATGFLADQFSLAVGLQSLVVAPMVGVVCTLAYVAVSKNRLWSFTRALVFLLFISLLTGCSQTSRVLVTPTPTKTPTSIPTITPTQTSTPTVTPTPTNTSTPTPHLPTNTPTSTPTPTDTPLPSETPTETPIPPPPTPTHTSTPGIDFRIASWRLWPLEFNSGCAKGMHTIFITVLDVAGNPLNNIIVGDSWNNVETVTGSKGPGKAEIDLWSNTMQLVVKRDTQGVTYTSEVSFPFSSFMTTIPNEQMIQAGYCSNDLECDWKRENDSYYCGGHYSWEVIFQKTY